MTQMATETIVEIETIVDDLTDHEFEPPCDMGPLDGSKRSGGCDRPARWVMHKKCCGGIMLSCDTCKEDRLMNRISVKCIGCGKLWPDAADCYSYIEPLGRA